MTDKAIHANVGTLSIGDMFWLMHRGFIVRKRLECGKVVAECIDDGGCPSLPSNTLVEVLIKKQ